MSGAPRTPARPEGAPLRGLYVTVLRSALGDHTLGGVTSEHATLFLVIPPELFTRPDDYRALLPYEPSATSAPALRLVERDYLDMKCGRGRRPGYYHAEPLHEGQPGYVGYMHGGNYIASSDSRFPFSFALPVHDRCESPATYAALSR